MSEFMHPDEAIVDTPLLDRADRASNTWQKLKKHLEARLQKLRTENDSPKLTDMQTAALRGEIAAVKNLLAHGASHAPADAANED